MTSISRHNIGRHPWYEELRSLEMEMLDPEVRGNPVRLRQLLRDDFVEFGSSGRVYHKRLLIDMMVAENHAPVNVRDFGVRPLSNNVALVTYRTVGQAAQEVRRSSVWVREGGRWQMAFHQGTRLPTNWGSID